MMNIKIVVAAHKKYKMPDDEMYLPLQVGSHGKDSIGFERDDTGDNISEKNPFFCELTAVYWCWKNTDFDYIGLSHYRRHFSIKRKKDVFSSVMTKEQAEKILENHPVILPVKQKYYIESIYSHYAHTHNKQHLEVLEDVLKQKYPEYLEEFGKLKKRTCAHMFNMFVMRRDIFNDYCTFLFGILFDVEKKIDFSDYSDFDARFIGRLSEILLDVWINKNKINYTEIPVIYTEKIDYVKKIKCFIGAKFFNKKYNGSF